LHISIGGLMSAVPKISSVLRVKVFCLLAILSVLLCSGAALAVPQSNQDVIPNSDILDLPATSNSLNYIEQIYVSGTFEATVTIVANMNRIEETFNPAWSVYKVTATGDQIGEKLDIVEFDANYGALQFTLSEPGTYKVTFRGDVSSFTTDPAIVQRDMYLCAIEAEDGSLIVYPVIQSVYILSPAIIVLHSDSVAIVERLCSIYSSTEILQMINDNMLDTMFGKDIRNSIREGTIDPNAAKNCVDSVAALSPSYLIGSIDSYELITALSIDAFNSFINFYPYEQINYLNFKPVARGHYSQIFVSKSGRFSYDTYGEIVGQNYSYFFRNGLLHDLYLLDLQYTNYNGEMVPVLNENIAEGTTSLIPSSDDKFQMHILSLPPDLHDLLNNANSAKFGRINVPQESVTSLASMSSLSFPAETINNLDGATIVVSTRNNGSEFLSTPEVSSKIDSQNTSVHLLVDVNFSKTPEELTAFNDILKDNPAVLSFKVPKITNGVPTNTKELKIYHIKEPDSVTPNGIFEELVIYEIIDYDDDFYEVITKTPGFSSFAVVTVKQDENINNPGNNTQSVGSGSGYGSATVSNNNPTDEFLSPQKPVSSMTGSFIPQIPILNDIGPLLEKTRGHFTLFSIMAVLLSGIGIWYYIRRQV
jgi:hypothetical protein